MLSIRPLTYSKTNFYFYLAIAITFISLLYWGVHIYVAYVTFKNHFYDLGLYTYSFYYNSHFLNLSNGFQYLVFGNHIAIDQLPILLIYYFLPSPLTLEFIQEIILVFTGLLIFVIVQDLIKNPKIAFALTLAYLLNPGLYGAITYDYHIEPLIIPLYLLTFYFYFTQNKSLFFASLLLLLLTMESVVFLVFMLGIALLYYEFRYNSKNKNKQSRLKLAGSIIVLSFLFYLFYSLATSSLVSSYTNGPNQHVPNLLRVIPFGANDLTALINSVFSFNSVILPIIRTNFIGIVVVIAVGILVFGISTLIDPLLVLLLIIPYFFSIFFSSAKTHVLNLHNQYFTFLLECGLVAALLGIDVSFKRKTLLWKLNVTRNNQVFIFLLSILFISFLIFAIFILSPVIINSFNSGTLNFESFGISGLNSLLNKSQEGQYADMNFIINHIPKNASLLVESTLSSHVANREYVKPPFAIIISNSNFTPQYILIDYNRALFNLPQTDYNYITNYIKKYNYSVYSQNGSAYLYKLPP